MLGIVLKIAYLNTEGKIGDLIMNSHGALEFHACDTLRLELKKHRLKLIGLFIITVLILRSKLHLLKCCCILCLLTYYGFFTLFGLGYLELSVIMQKVYNISSMLLVLGLEYFTKPEDFIAKSVRES